MQNVVFTKFCRVFVISTFIFMIKNPPIVDLVLYRFDDEKRSTYAVVDLEHYFKGQ